MATTQTSCRLPDDLVTAARAGTPELADQPRAVLVRVGLAVLAGLGVSEALSRVAGPARTSPIPDDFAALIYKTRVPKGT